MTRLVIALVALVCWVAATRVVFRLIDRNLGDSDAAKSRRERVLSKVAAGVVWASSC